MELFTTRQAIAVLQRCSDLLKRSFEEIRSRGDLNPRRQSFVLASILKVQSAAKAAAHLSGIHAVEEIWAINRSLTELVVNTAYFQIAEEAELDRFQYFDFMHIPKQSKKLRVTLPDGGNVPKHVEVALARMVKDAKRKSGRADKDISWSKYSVQMRAELTDIAIKQNNLLKRMVLTSNPYGHAAVHNTFFSYPWFLSGIKREHDVPDEAREAGLAMSLHATVMALQHLCCAVDALFSLGLMAELERASIPPVR